MKPSALALLVLIANIQQANASTTYTLAILPVVTTSNRPTSSAYGINASGQVVGAATSYPDTREAVTWPIGGSGQQSIGLSTAYAATGISDSGEVVGNYSGGAFYWSSTKGVLDIGSGSVRGINNSGQVVGTDNGQVFVWSIAEGRSFLTPQGGRGNGVGEAINDNGEVVGYVVGSPIAGYSDAARWSSSGALQILTRTTAGDVDFAFGINSTSVVVGTERNKNDYQYRAMLWDANGSPQVLGYGHASDINDSGQVVGNREAGSDRGEGAPFLWTSADGQILLQSLLANGGDYPDFVLLTAEAINDRGQITGTGMFYDPKAPQYSIRRAFLLTPVPIPPAVWLFGSAIALMGVMRRKVSG